MSDVQPKDQDPQGQEERPQFPEYNNFPLEIKSLIMTQAMRKPNVHFIIAGHRYTSHIPQAAQARLNQWNLDFSPVHRKQDTSGYRLIKELALVNKDAYNAVRLSTKKDRARLPFKAMTTRVNAAEDLICIRLKRSRRSGTPYGYWHSNHQILNTNTFNADAMAQQFAPFRKVALPYSYYDKNCMSVHGLFRCLHSGAVAQTHGLWNMCPLELCGFLDCFPILQEFYIILAPRQETMELDYVKAYINKFFKLLSADDRRRRKLTMFYDTDRAYIEVNEQLLQEKLAPSDVSLSLNVLEQLPFVVNMLRELKQEFLRDADKLSDEEVSMGLAQTYRIPRQQRENLVVKVLIATNGED
ncbi:hypothetical protein VTK56DRAFT_3583 [Thermocarpiscus australiensis]